MELLGDSTEKLGELSPKLRDKAARLFRFVQAFNDRRNPPLRDIRSSELWRLSLYDLPNHPSLQIAPPVQDRDDDHAGSGEAGEEVGTDDLALLRCGRPDLTARPREPEILLEWLGPDWDNCRTEPQPRSSRNITENDETIVERFEDSGERVAGLESYRATWTDWAAQEKLTLDAADIFGRLYELYGILQRDPDKYDLVVGNGILTWKNEGQELYHPLLTRTLRLEFDAETPEFAFFENTSRTDFAAGLFAGMENVDGTLLGRISEEIDAAGVHPLGAVGAPAMMRSIVTRLGPDGQYIDAPPIPKPGASPVVVSAPIMFLQNRTTGLARAIAAVVAAIEAGGTVPEPLLNIIGQETPSGAAPSATSGGGGEYFAPDASADRETLFTRRANPQQLAIAKKFDHTTGVIVQGPPGTGKTHTIGNLIGHLLAQGKTILATSHSSKALKVLKENVVPELQSLCVSVLDSANDDVALKASINGITERLGFADEVQLNHEIATFSEERLQLIDKLEDLKSQLRLARQDAYRDVLLAGEGVKPNDAAKEVAAGVGTHDWLPGPVTLGVPLPLTPLEVEQLYATNVTTTAADELAIDAELPEIDGLIAPSGLQTLADELRTLDECDLNHGIEFWDNENAAESTVAALDLALKAATEAINAVDQMPPWGSKLVDIGLTNRESETWLRLIGEIEAYAASIAEAREALITHNPGIPTEISLDDLHTAYSTVVREINRTGKPPGMITRMTNAHVRIAMDQSIINGNAKPRTLEHFQALKAKCALTSARNRIATKWSNLAEPLGLTPIDDGTDEAAMLIHVRSLNAALTWHTNKWKPAHKKLSEVGLKWDDLLADSVFLHVNATEFRRLAHVVNDLLPTLLAAEQNRRRRIELLAEYERLQALTTTWQASPLATKLGAAITALEVSAYRVGYDDVVRLGALSKTITERRRLLAKLDPVAATWADRIRRRIGTHGAGQPPGDVKLSWRWRQFEDELDRRGKVVLADIGRSIEDTRAAIQAATVNLVDRRAWLYQKQRLSLKERAALHTFANAKKQYGRGTGKNAARLLAVQRTALSDARTAVPVWIMPITKAVEVFDPQSSRFDVVIIDEASQSDVTSLVALYLGKKVLVVGDDEQVSPLGAGTSVEDIQHIADVFLHDFRYRETYTPRLSLYDLAQGTFGGAIMLREHFRCLPDIIGYSNKLSYNGNIRPLRDVSGDLPMPAVVEYRVDGHRTGDVNEAEAKAVVALLKACIEQDEYARNHEDKIATFGVVVLMGESQARYIERLLFRVLDPDEITTRRIVCGSPSQFQGDERDVMFLSMVYQGNDDSGPLPMLGKTEAKQRFNVAASRAKNQMWLVHSLDKGTDLQPDDIRRVLIEHIRDPKAAERANEAAKRLAESPFEMDVLDCLTRAGYRVVGQWKVGAYRIDMVVVGDNGQRLAVECDGERSHGQAKLEHDMLRQADLERLGWRFVRIRGFDFYRQPNVAMRPIFERLKTLGIEPYEAGAAPPDENLSEKSELLDRVRRRTAEILVEIETLEDIGAPLIGHRAFGKARAVPKALVPEPSRPDTNGGPSSPQSAIPRPVVGSYPTIDDYPRRELVLLSKWKLDQLKVNDAEMLARAVSRELGNTRFGARIRSRLLPIARSLLRVPREARRAESKALEEDETP